MTLLFIALCLLVSFIFSGIETGILSVNRVRLAHRAKQRDAAALKLERLLAHPDRLLITVLVVTNLANIFALVLGTLELVAVLGKRGYLAAFALYLPLYLLGLELLPKSLFRRFPYRALAALAEPLRRSIFDAVRRAPLPLLPQRRIQLVAQRDEIVFHRRQFSERTGR